MLEEKNMELQDIVSKYPPRQIMLLPIIIIILALISLGATYFATGSPVKLGVEFTGGTLVTVPSEASQEEVAAEFEGYPLVDIRDIGNRYMMQFGPMSDAEYTELAKLANEKFVSPEIRHMGPIYSKELQEQVVKYIPLSFILMAIVVFLVFRELVVSLLVVICALADILIAAASMNLTGVQLSLGTVAALLMLIGYSVDTDLLLSMRVLKRKGAVDEKIIGAMGTGLTMAGTTIAAVISLIIISNFLYLIVPSFTRMDVIADMSTVLIFGLAADIFNTWVTNAQGLRWYLGRPKKAARGQKR
ncbi:protein translocase subunit SecF [Methanothrix sp.]|uniref:protein translocase subunit SecF n=1 Tax=Methanothrix sp. TaxID=90426 RepID=UPI002D1FBF6A|nr:protein translocase subunit SecF [Methanothrix sp.]